MLPFGRWFVYSAWLTGAAGVRHELGVRCKVSSLPFSWPSRPFPFLYLLGLRKGKRGAYKCISDDSSSFRSVQPGLRTNLNLSPRATFFVLILLPLDNWLYVLLRTRQHEQNTCVRSGYLLPSLAGNNLRKIMKSRGWCMHKPPLQLEARNRGCSLVNISCEQLDCHAWAMHVL